MTFYCKKKDEKQEKNWKKRDKIPDPSVLR